MAVEYFSKAIAVDGTVAKSHNDLGEAYRALGRLEEAVACYTDALRLQPDLAAAHNNLGKALREQGRLEEAVACYIEALRLRPDYVTAHNNLGTALWSQGRLKEAVACYTEALRLQPDYATAHNNLGTALREQGRLEEAVACYTEALRLQPDYATAHSNLGKALWRQGRVEEAVACYTEALRLKPNLEEAHLNLATVLMDLDRWEEAEECCRRTLALDPAAVPARVTLAKVLRARGQGEAAVKAVEEGLALSPSDAQLGLARRELYSGLIPAWHIPMINDAERNDAYDRALRRVVTPDTMVLEIGTGSALVAMMAARAGAAHVTTCEISRPLARVAAETVARNGLDGRITVVPKHSIRLRIGVDLPRRADLLVLELFATGLVGEANMLDVLRHARHALLTPAALVVPAAGTVSGLLIQCDELARINPVGALCGFDLGAFDVFRRPGYAWIDLAADRYEPLSEPFRALDFDFRRDMPEAGGCDLAVAATADGLCHGVAFWFDLLMVDDPADPVVYSSANRSHWKQAVQFFDRPLPLRRGDTVALRALYDRRRITFEVAPPETSGGPS
jgi:tetratricopeptide (TPR) repeat protein